MKSPFDPLFLDDAVGFEPPLDPDLAGPPAPDDPLWIAYGAPETPALTPTHTPLRADVHTEGKDSP